MRSADNALKRESKIASSRFDEIVRVIVVSPLEEDRRRLDDILQSTNWTLFSAGDYENAMAILMERKISVVITEPLLSQGKTWLDLLDRSLRPRGPRIVVAPHSGDDALWAEVLNLGGYDVLPKPFNKPEVIRVVSLAWLDWLEAWSPKYRARLLRPFQCGGPRNVNRQERLRLSRRRLLI